MNDSLYHHHLFIYHINLSKLNKSDSEYEENLFPHEGSQAGEQLAQICRTISSLRDLQDPSGSSPEQAGQTSELILPGQEVWPETSWAPSHLNYSVILGSQNSPLTPNIPPLQFIDIRLTLPCLRYPNAPQSSTSLRRNHYIVSIPTKLTTALISTLSPSAELTITSHARLF